MTAKSKKPVILIVEDDRRTQKLLLDHFARKYALTTAKNLVEAYAIIENQVPDIIISDILLPGGSGIELLKFVNSRSIQSPFIFMSGQSGKQEILIALKLGAFDFIEKPFSVDQITLAVKKAADMIQMRGELLSAQIRCHEAEKLASIAMVTMRVIHEVSNPLTVMQSLSHSILEDLSREAPATGTLAKSKKLNETLQHVVKIILNRKALLRVGKPDEIEAISISRLVKQAANICRDHFEYKKIRFINEANSQELVEVNLTELNQVLINLFLNSVHALENQDRKWIKATISSQNENYIVVSIIDNGVGVKPEDSDKVFSPFFTTKPPGKGSGLGLSTSREIMKSYNGNLTLELENPNTCFSIKIPLRHKNARKRSVEL